MFKPLGCNPAVNLVFETPQGLPPIHSDEAKVAQILRNLISSLLSRICG
jgi:signal transduction histidine kinase